MGCPPPQATENNRNGIPRLKAEFAEWLMGWPAGHVTDPELGISYVSQLRLTGNGVMPQQAAAAISALLCD
jgi:DNA (cytosine-5)-methyltransferase 1